MIYDLQSFPVAKQKAFDIHKTEKPTRSEFSRKVPVKGI